jgi:hypothetical protein
VRDILSHAAVPSCGRYVQAPIHIGQGDGEAVDLEFCYDFGFNVSVGLSKATKASNIPVAQFACVKRIRKREHRLGMLMFLKCIDWFASDAPGR